MSPAGVHRDREAAGVLRWGLCLLLVAGVHLGMAVLLLRRGPVPVLPSPAPEAVLMDLAPEPAAPAPAPPQPASQMASAPPPSPPAPEPPLPPQPAPEPPPVPAQALPPAEPAPQALAPATPLAPEPATALPPPRVSPPPMPTPARPAPKRAPPPRAVPRQPPRPTQDAAQAQAPAGPAANIQAAPPAPASAPAAPPAPAASAASSPSAVPGWRGELIGRLQRAKRYPDVARERDEQGVASVTFTMDRSGHVLSASLVRSSGSQALDEEAVALVRRAEPLPSIPAELPGNTVKLTLPVTFSLR